MHIIGFDYSFLLPSTNDRVPCVYLDGHYVVNLDKSDPLYVGKKDEIVAKKEVVIKSLGDKFRKLEGISAATILSEGKVGYIIDINQIVTIKKDSKSWVTFFTFCY